MSISRESTEMRNILESDLRKIEALHQDASALADLLLIIGPEIADHVKNHPTAIIGGYGVEALGKQIGRIIREAEELISASIQAARTAESEAAKAPAF